MNEHINIISKEAVTVVSSAPVIIVGSIIITIMVYLFVKDNHDRCVKMLTVLCIIGFPILLLTALISSLFFRVPTGQFKYTATVDENNMTIAEYKAFIEEYNPEIDDNGVYHFTTNIDIENK